MTTTDRYEALYQCYITEQMSMAQMHQHMADDEVFARWMERRLAQRRRSA
jgi:hypothetical protein